jgi:hypothetical protein
MFPLMHLFVSHLDPISVESVVPESTPTIVSGMGLAAINALSSSASCSVTTMCTATTLLGTSPSGLFWGLISDQVTVSYTLEAAVG